MQDRSNQITNVLKQRPKPLVQFGNFVVLLSIIAAVYFSKYIELPVYTRFYGVISGIDVINNHTLIALTITDKGNFNIKEGVSAKAFNVWNTNSSRYINVRLINVKKNFIELYVDKPVDSEYLKLTNKKIYVEVSESSITLFDCFFKK